MPKEETLSDAWQANAIANAIGLVILAVALCGVYGWFKWQDHQKDHQKEIRNQEWTAKNDLTKAELAEKEKEPIPDSLSGEWTWKPTNQTRIFLTLEKGDGGFVLRHAFTDGSKLENTVSAKREGGTIVLRPKEESPTGDYWVIDEALNLVVMDREGTIGRASPKSDPLEIK